MTDYLKFISGCQSLSFKETYKIIQQDKKYKNTTKGRREHFYKTYAKIIDCRNNIKYMKQIKSNKKESNPKYKNIFKLLKTAKVLHSLKSIQKEFNYTRGAVVNIINYMVDMKKIFKYYLNGKVIKYCLMSKKELFNVGHTYNLLYDKS